MVSDKQKKQKNPSDEGMKFILKLFNSNKFIEAKYEIEKQIVSYPNSPILYNMLGAVLAGQNYLKEAIESYKREQERIQKERLIRLAHIRSMSKNYLEKIKREQAEEEQASMT